jgi:type II secretory ATPase GspE/PulE/Tfp pilus assembly ATPase PilB-like protein
MAQERTVEHDRVRSIPLAGIQARVIELLEAGNETAVGDAVDVMISQGAYHGASDLHFEPWSECVSVRYRLDGMLQQVATIPRDYQPKVMARIKVLADLVLYRKDVPQDGRIEPEKTSCGRPMRVSTVPTVKGEKTVIRLLGDTQHLFPLDSLGFQPEVVAGLRDMIGRNQGTLLLTGPSSAGKTTTIYSLLQEIMRLDASTRNIVTVEDPVEYTMDRISQIQVNPAVEFDFATALRAILRQDPEVIMVGEIRDTETATIAIRAGLTGHYVISTIHSGTAAGVFSRLLDMGIEPFLVASSVTGVLSQRLVRLNCPECTAAYTPNAVLLEHFGLAKNKKKFFRGSGCASCKGIGYRGRASIGELLEVTEFIGQEILHRHTTSKLQEAAVKLGMETLEQDGLKKVHKGITTLDELLRVLPMGSR